MIATEVAFITVNGIAITQAQIDQELPNHSAETPEHAKMASMRVLVIRELLLQEAIKWGLCDRDGVVSKPEEAIEKLLAVQIKVPEPNDADCERYFNENRNNFSTAPQCEASHIFYPASLSDQVARGKAREKAEIALAKITDNPQCFGDIARLESACSSASGGGCLGAVSKGQTVPAFESALMAMEKGEISSQPVETEVGYHIIRLDERISGEGMPFVVLKNWILQYLRSQGRQKAVNGYVRGLADKAEIQGFDLVDL